MVDGPAALFGWVDAVRDSDHPIFRLGHVCGTRGPNDGGWGCFWVRPWRGAPGMGCGMPIVTQCREGRHDHGQPYTLSFVFNCACGFDFDLACAARPNHRTGCAHCNAANWFVPAALWEARKNGRPSQWTAGEGHVRFQSDCKATEVIKIKKTQSWLRDRGRMAPSDGDSAGAEGRAAEKAPSGIFLSGKGLRVG